MSVVLFRNSRPLYENHIWVDTRQKEANIVADNGVYPGGVIITVAYSDEQGKVSYFKVCDGITRFNELPAIDGSGTDGLQGITAGENISIDNTDPKNPVISSTGGGAVASVNGDVGDVELAGSDIPVEIIAPGGGLMNGSVQDLSTVYGNTINGILNDFNALPPVAATGSYDDLTDKPDTFAPIIGTTATTAAAGNHTHSVATTSANGFMASADKTKLNGIAAGATVGATWGANITNQPAVIAAGATQAEARTAIGAGTSSLSLTGAGGNNGSSSNAARADHTHASIAGVPSINSAAITITSGAGTVDLSARQNFYCDIIENTVLTLSGIIYNVEYTIDVVNTGTVQNTISIDGVNYIGNQDFSIPPGKGAVISIKQLSSSRPIRAVISVEPA